MQLPQNWIQWLICLCALAIAVLSGILLFRDYKGDDSDAAWNYGLGGSILGLALIILAACGYKLYRK